MTVMAAPVEETSEESAPEEEPRRLGWVFAIAVGVVAGAGFLRFWDLGQRALHHDESLHAYFSWRFAEFFTYDHNPLMHGPFQFHIIAGVFTLFGDSDFTARVAAAAFGTLLVALPFFLRDYLGRPGWIITAVFIALSPTLLYFSRFARGDMFVAVWTLLMVIFIWRYLANPRPAFLAGLAAALALSFATKETTFLTSLIFIGYLNVYTGRELWRRLEGKPVERIQRAATAGAFILGAWAIASLWPLLGPLRRRLSVDSLPVSAAPLLVMGLLTAPQFSAGAQVPAEALGVDLARQWTTFQGHPMTTEIYLGIGAVAFFLVATFAVGFAWNWRTWLLVVAAFYLPYIVLFTTLGTEQDGFASGIWGSLDYWLAQQDVQRGNQPWFYYLMTVPIYEFATLTFALLGGWWALRRGGAFDRFLIVWFLGTLISLSIAGEKMPWLTVHLALPLALLAGRFLGRVVSELGLTARDGGIVSYWRPACVGLAVFLLALSARTSVIASFEHSDRPYELLVYVQTTQELVRVSEMIDAEAARTGLGHDLPIIVDSSDGFTWPWAWYLRDYDHVGYISFDEEYDPPGDSVVLANSGNLGEVDASLYDRQVRYEHRAWFPEAYKHVKFGDFLTSIFDGGTFSRWWRFLARREFEPELGHIDGVAFFPRSYEATD
ncbi:MAG: flippase activity-associated protein Agl23 [Dehalococcoidia bacterium]